MRLFTQVGRNNHLWKVLSQNFIIGEIISVFGLSNMTRNTNQ
jgi:hypothetical protein